GFLGAPRPPLGAWIPSARHLSCGEGIPPTGGHPGHAPALRRDSRRGAGEAISQLVKWIRAHTVCLDARVGVRAAERRLGVPRAPRDDRTGGARATEIELRSRRGHAYAGGVAWPVHSSTCRRRDCAAHGPYLLLLTLSADG